MYVVVVVNHTLTILNEYRVVVRINPKPGKIHVVVVNPTPT